MHAQGTATPRNGLVIASGYGLKLYVDRGHLVIHDGVGTRRQTRRYNRATGGLRRLVVLGHDGYITLDALHWLKDTGAALVQLDHHGQVIALSAAAGPDIAKLRRAQAGAPTTEVGFGLAQEVLAEKLDGQAAVASQLPGKVDVAEIHRARNALDQAHAIDGLLMAESAAAAAYWKAWAEVATPFPARQASRLPVHWLTFGQRHSQLTRSPRLATNPANAILNYLYALLEAETTLALQAIGLDPGMGIFHTDKPGRASMSLDVMEACRPAVDAYLLGLLTQRTLSPRDFIETSRGACRLRPAFARQLAETATVWEGHVAPMAERVAQLLAHATNQPLPTTLTQFERRAAWSTQRASRKRTARLPDTCRDCGDALPDRRHRYCPACRQKKWGNASQTGRDIAADVLQQLRDNGHDPAHGGHAAQLRGGKNALHQAAIREWNKQHGDGHDPERFASDIAPGLRTVPIDSLVRATGLSAHYCSLIRLGKRTPHPRHWPALDSAASRAHPA